MESNCKMTWRVRLTTATTRNYEPDAPRVEAGPPPLAQDLEKANEYNYHDRICSQKMEKA